MGKHPKDNELSPEDEAKLQKFKMICDLADALHKASGITPERPHDRPPTPLEQEIYGDSTEGREYPDRKLYMLRNGAKVRRISNGR